MAQPISALPINAKVKDTGTLYYGKAIIWSIKDKNHAGYPDNSVTLMSEYILALKCFDAKEDENSDADRAKSGNNRYAVANMLQWMNSTAAAGHWYSAQHSADAPPNSANVQQVNGAGANPYETEAGFLNGFSENMCNALLTTTVTVAQHTGADDGGPEQVTSKIFLASTTEVGLANENNIAEGSLLAGYSDDASRVAYPTAECVSNSVNYANDSVAANLPWMYWLRSPHFPNPSIARCVSASGTLTFATALSGIRGFRPLCNLSSEILVSDTADSDGVYTIQWNQAPAILCDEPTNLGEKSSGFRVAYQAHDEDGDALTVTEEMDGALKRSFPAASGEAHSFDCTGEYFMKLLNGPHTMQVTAADPGGLSDELRLTWTKAVHALRITLAEPMPSELPITRMVLSVSRSIPADAMFRVLAANNALDDDPAWEDVTAKVLAGINHLFENEAAEKGPAFNFIVEAARADGGEGGYISSIGGAFE